MTTTTPPTEHQATLWMDDFIFLEAPRWHQNRLWIADVFDKKLYTLQPDGSRTVLGEVPNRPCGIGFLPDGSAVVVSMRDRKILKVGSEGFSVYADLSTLAAGDVNDLVVDAQGRIYVGNFGYDHHGGAPVVSTKLLTVEPDGATRIVEGDLEFPNGMAIIHGGRTLVVAETWAGRLSAFDRAPDGSLSNRRLFADLGGRQPDGICADAGDGIWAACFNTGEFIRVEDGGQVTDRVVCGRHAIACALGGPQGNTLFCSAYTGTVQDMEAGKRLAAVFTVDVKLPGIAA